MKLSADKLHFLDFRDLLDYDSDNAKSRTFGQPLQ